MRIHADQAIVVIARHLLTVVWCILTHHEPYRHFSLERIAYKYLIWAWALHVEERRGMTRSQYARCCLMRLGFGDELKRVALKPEFPYRLAAVEEVLELHPELRPPCNFSSFSLEKPNSTTKMLAEAVEVSPTRKKILLKAKTG